MCVLKIHCKDELIKEEIRVKIKLKEGNKQKHYSNGG